MDEIFPAVPFWAGDSPAAEADEIMANIRHLGQSG